MVDMDKLKNIIDALEFDEVISLVGEGIRYLEKKKPEADWRDWHFDIRCPLHECPLKDNKEVSV